MSANACGLSGKGVVITRAETAPGPLERCLAARGARVLRWTALAVAPPSDPAPLAAALAALAARDGYDRYDWIVFPSAHAAAAVVGETPARPPALRVAAVGSGTARALERHGWRVDRVPPLFNAAALVASFAAAGDARGARILLPESEVGRDELAAGLTALGAVVERVAAYTTVPAELDVASCGVELAAGEVDAITFASPSAVEVVEAAFGAGSLARLFAPLVVASIGPTTSAALVAHRRAPDAEASPSTFEALAEAVERALVARSPVAGDPRTFKTPTGAPPATGQRG